jgi:hypothetical protein
VAAKVFLVLDNKEIPFLDFLPCGMPVIILALDNHQLHDSLYKGHKIEYYLDDILLMDVSSCI